MPLVSICETDKVHNRPISMLVYPIVLFKLRLRLEEYKVIGRLRNVNKVCPPPTII